MDYGEKVMQLTAGELRSRLEGIPDDATITFGQFSFNRVKKRGSNCYDIELSPLVYWSPEDEQWLVVGNDPPSTLDE